MIALAYQELIMRHVRCVGWALLGAVTGCAAYAQDHPVIQDPSAHIDTSTMFLQMFQAGGLPAVLAAIGFLFGRGVITPQITVRLSDEDRKILTERK